MKKLGILLIMLSIISSFIYVGYNHIKKQKNMSNINTYINETSNKNENVETLEKINNESNKENNNIKKINYTAILEIPSIKLKEGLVDSTKNFNSINYAVSVDKNSNYPNEMGNFILYAHSGNSSVAFFKNINKVKLNDTIYVYFNGVKYKYVVSNIYDIKKTGKAEVIKTNNSRVVTLITCNQHKEGYQTIVIGKMKSEEKY